MEAEQDWYALLKSSIDDDIATIGKAYRQLSLKYHPDKLKQMQDREPGKTEVEKEKERKEYLAKFLLIKQAYEILSDEAARRAYDELVRSRMEKKRKLDEMAQDRRMMKEELEAREQRGAQASAQYQAYQRELERIRQKNSSAVTQAEMDSALADEKTRLNIDVDDDILQRLRSGKSSIDGAITLRFKWGKDVAGKVTRDEIEKYLYYYYRRDAFDTVIVGGSSNAAAVSALVVVKNRFVAARLAEDKTISLMNGVVLQVTVQDGELPIDYAATATAVLTTGSDAPETDEIRILRRLRHYAVLKRQ